MSNCNEKTVTIPAWVLKEVLELAKPRAQEMSKELSVFLVTTPEQIPAELVAVAAAVVSLAGKDVRRPAEIA
jgi:hypothetical protein